MKTPKIVSRKEWLASRKELLIREKAFTQERDALSRARRDLPWVRVDKAYRFDGPDGEESLADLFGQASQLLIYHFMFHPDWDEGCKSCSFFADNYSRIAPHLSHRDVSLVTVSRAPLEKLQAFRTRMDWDIKWVSSFNTDFNEDYHVSFSAEQLEQNTAYYNYKYQGFPVEEAPGVSVFYKDEAGDIFHTYSCYARGLDILNGAYNYLDLAPKGRDEADLPYTMAWLQLRDQY